MFAALTTSSAPGANPATVAHRPERLDRPESSGGCPRAIRLEGFTSLNATERTRQRHGNLVGWDGAGPEQANHRFELVGASARRVDRRSRALAARAASRQPVGVCSHGGIRFRPTRRIRTSHLRDPGRFCLPILRGTSLLFLLLADLRRWYLLISRQNACRARKSRYRRLDLSPGGRQSLRLSGWRAGRFNYMID